MDQVSSLNLDPPFPTSARPIVASTSRQMAWIHLSWPGLVVTLGLLATAIATIAAWNSVEQKDRERFLQEVERTHTAMVDHMDNYLAVLQATAALFAASEKVTRAEFHTFTS